MASAGSSEDSPRPSGAVAHPLLRAIAAFLAMPGVVAYGVPWLILRPLARAPGWYPFGLVLLLGGTFLLLWCVRDFYVAGRGTLAPWSPPRNLVVIGLYRYSRNPMYVTVALTLFGWSATFASSTVLLYALVVIAAFHLRVVFGEEPWLARTHGAAWQEYRARVPRWLC